MKTTETLHNAGQSLWLDNITRDLLTSGTLKRYIDTLSVTGLTSNPTIYDHAISKSAAYDEDIRAMMRSGIPHEDLFFRLAIADLQRAADLFRPIHDQTAGVDGWVSLEVSPPLLAYDAQPTVEAASSLYTAAARPNLFIKIPGTMEGARAIEEAIFRGVPINVTLLFSREHYLAAGEAYMRARAPDRLGLEPGRSLGCVAVRQPLGQGGDGQAAGELEGSSGHRRRRNDLRGLPGSPRLGSLVAPRKLWGAPATPAVREHGNERPARFRHALYRRFGGAKHHQQSARGNAVAFRRSWRSRRPPASRRKARERDAVGDRQGGCRSWRVGRGPPIRRLQDVRRVPGAISSRRLRQSPGR